MYNRMNRHRIVFSLLLIIALTSTVSLRARHSLWKENINGASRYYNGNPDPFATAKNSTLGFTKIIYINLPNRYDRDDVMLMQGTEAGLDLERFEAINANDFSDDGKGFPPHSSKDELGPRHKGCYRSHVELWKRMIRERWKSLLIMEGDTTWDSNIREINHKIAYNLHLLRKNSHNATDIPDIEDPFGSEYWDMVSFGTCRDSERYREQFVMFDDPDGPVNHKYYDHDLHNQRVIRRSGYPVCAAGYAISRRGARKLLARTNFDFNKPVDLVIAEMTSSGDLLTYSVFPATIPQWRYVKGIGADKSGSSIDSVEESKLDQDKAAKVWSQARKDRTIWRLRESEGYDNSVKNMAIAAFYRSALERTYQL